MAERIDKVELSIEGKDNFSAVADKAFDKVVRKAEDASKQVERAAARPQRTPMADAAPVYGPAVKPRFAAEEADRRAELAGRIRAMSDQADRARREEDIRRRLFGDPAPERKPLRDPQRSPTEQRNRDERASLLREIRDPLSGAGLSRGSGAGGRGGDGGASAAVSSALSKSAATLGDVDWYKRLQMQGRGLENALKVAKGVGVLTIVGEVGRALQRLPAAVDLYAETLAKGSTKTEAVATVLADALPEIGDLAKGFRAVLNLAERAGDELSATVSARAEAGRRKAENDARNKARENRDTRRNERFAPVEAAGEAARRASQDLEDASGSPAGRSVREAARTRDRALAEIAKDDAKRSGVGPDKQEAFDKAQADRRQAANEAYAAAEKEAADKLAEQELQAARSLEDKRAAIKADAERRRLEAEGKTTEAAVLTINERAEAEKRQVQREYEDLAKQYEDGSLELFRAKQRRDQNLKAIEDGRATEAADAVGAGRNADRRDALTRARDLAVEQGGDGRGPSVSRGFAGSEGGTTGARLTAAETFVPEISKQAKLLASIDETIKKQSASNARVEQLARDLLRSLDKIAAK